MQNINREAHAQHYEKDAQYAAACEIINRHARQQAEQYAALHVAATPGASPVGSVTPAELAAAESVLRAYHEECELRKARSRHASDRWLASVTNGILELCPGVGSPLFCLGAWGACALCVDFVVLLLIILIYYIYLFLLLLLLFILFYIASCHVAHTLTHLAPHARSPPRR